MPKKKAPIAPVIVKKVYERRMTVITAALGKLLLLIL
jgi:hypothetical protein